MRFGISATSLMCPKNLRTLLRPVNVCCAIVASHLRRPGGANLPKPDFQEFCPEFVLQTFKTQNDARAHNRTRPSQLFVSRTEKARNLTVSQRLTPGTVFSCCRPDMGWQSRRFEG